MSRDETRPLTDEELNEITARAAGPRPAEDPVEFGNLQAIVAEVKARRSELDEARLVLRSALSDSWEQDGLERLPVADLVRHVEKRLGASEEETRRLQFLIRRLHDSMPNVPGVEDLKAELSREVVRIVGG